MFLLRGWPGTLLENKWISDCWRLKDQSWSHDHKNPLKELRTNGIICVTDQVRSYLLYKRIQHQWLVRNSAERMQEHQKYAKLPLVPTLVTPEGKGLQDSTPIIEQLEVQFPERSIYPSCAVGKFMSQLLEEFGDEWGCLGFQRERHHFCFVFFDVEAAIFKSNLSKMGPR